MAEVVPTAGGEPIATLALPARATNATWSPDGTSLTFVDQSDPTWNLARLRIAGGVPERITHFTEGRTTAFEWSPDGSRLAVARKLGDGAAVFVTGSDGSKPVQVARFQGEEIFRLRFTSDGKHVVVLAGKRSSDAVLIRNFR
jgi:Tol biopolymer transport system component